MYTVKQLADLAGVTVRTLHYYDRIGLLKPSSVGANSYRYYGDEALYRLQQILFYRELDMPLEDILRILERPDFDVVRALEEHRSALQSETRRLRRLIHTIDSTTKHLKGKQEMNPKKLFEGFTEEEQERYAAEAAEKWDPRTVQASNAKWKAYSPEQKQRILEEGRAVYADLIAARPQGASSAGVQAAIARWHAHMQYFWSPSDDQLLGLADIYNEDPRFRATYENMAAGLAGFMREAIKIYFQRRK